MVLQAVLAIMQVAVALELLAHLHTVAEVARGEEIATLAMAEVAEVEDAVAAEVADAVKATILSKKRFR